MLQEQEGKGIAPELGREEPPTTPPTVFLQRPLLAMANNMLSVKGSVSC